MIYTYINIYTSTYIHIYIYTIYTYIHIFAYIYIYVYIRLHWYIQFNLFIHLYISLHIHRIYKIIDHNHDHRRRWQYTSTAIYYVSPQLRLKCAQGRDYMNIYSTYRYRSVRPRPRPAESQSFIGMARASETAAMLQMVHTHTYLNTHQLPLASFSFHPTGPESYRASLPAFPGPPRAGTLWRARRTCQIECQ